MSGKVSKRDRWQHCCFFRTVLLRALRTPSPILNRNHWVPVRARSVRSLHAAGLDMLSLGTVPTKGFLLGQARTEADAMQLRPLQTSAKTFFSFAQARNFVCTLAVALL